MSRACKLQSAVDLPAAVEPAPVPYELPPTDAPQPDETDPFDEDENDPFDEDETDPYYYGWREQWHVTPDGGEEVHRTPLTYGDLLDPQEGDFIAEDTVHRRMVEDVANILKRRYQTQPSVAVWSNLKVLFKIPGLTGGPGPDVCVVEGVRDRDRQRRSFAYGKEPGKLRLVVEVVSKSSLKKDYRDLLKIYAPLGVEEYVTIHPLGYYVSGPFMLKGWRLDRRRVELLPIPPLAGGRIPSQTTGLLFGPDLDSGGVGVWDAVTGERLRTSEEGRVLAVKARHQAEHQAEQEATARWQAEQRAERAEQRAAQEAAARRQADERAAQEAAARRKAEQEKHQAERRWREMIAEIQLLRAQLPGREGDA